MTTADRTASDRPGAPAGDIAAPRAFESVHKAAFHDVECRYRCLAAETHLPDAEGRPKASLFSFSYLVEATDPASRPVTFLFNGGPGSASLWLHMGGLGPRMVRLPAQAAPAGAGPYSVQDNGLCNLDRSDLVFIDPPGTGYSRMLGPHKPEEAWGLEADAALIASFIRAWLTQHRRWSSPRFLCGESYGTTRAVMVAGQLAGGLSSVAFNGLALISAVLDFHTVQFDPGHILPDVCFLPTYAATAHYHGRVTPAPASRDAFLDAARRFAGEEYLPALFAGSRLDEAERIAVRDGLAYFTGLSPDWLDRTRLRIEPGRFRKELLRDRGQTVGRLDSRYLGADHDDGGEAPDADAASHAMDSAFVSSVNDHLTRMLGIDWDRPYVPFNEEALKQWDWQGSVKPERRRGPAYINVAPTLGRLLRENPGLRVLLASGLYDLATPFHAAETTIAGNGIDAGRVRMTWYEAGHMMYVHEPALAALAADLRQLLG
jgi:carboxypeptidase C (cathepsin A)